MKNSQTNINSLRGIVETTQHYKRFEELPFLAGEKQSTTILLGGFTARHDYFVRAGIEGLGYKVQDLPTPNIEAYHVGREYCNNGMCNPTYFTVGNLVNYLKKLEASGIEKSDIVKNYAFLTAGACGPCRFGMYENEFRLALRNSGFGGFRVLVFQQFEGFDQSKQGNGLLLNEEFFLGILNGLVLADIINDLGNKIRPYEINKGETDRILADATEIIYQTIKKKQSQLDESKIIKIFQKFTRSKSKSLYALLTDQMLSDVYPDALRVINEKLKAVVVDPLRVVPKIKITGEFWAQTTEGDGNFKMFRYLGNEGAEIIKEPITNWLLYLLYDGNQLITDRKEFVRTYIRPKLLIKFGEFILKKEYNRFRKSTSNLPQSLSNQYQLEQLAHKYYNTRAKGGEGHLEVSKSIYYTKNHLAHLVLSLKPFGCLPSTQSDGVHSVVTSHHPDMLFLPIETSAEGEINAYSRVQMGLTEARLRCKLEYEKSLDGTGLTEEEVRKFISENPEMQNPFFKIPKVEEVASRAATIVYFVKKQIK
ncbi:MAG: activator of (R)-2-hydroxyglutaryl-CoA dehydratase [Bacteroidota bacterium]|nr:activator of (R)-2-hydroxyglutaryl-CoA dehydratase [Bacteroidota bacterium]